VPGGSVHAVAGRRLGAMTTGSLDDAEINPGGMPGGTTSPDGAAGSGRSGRKTLLGALGVHHNEVVMCRGLAWLLTPNAWHGLGSSVLDELLTAMGLPSGGSGAARVVVEESRENTRADIVVRFADTTVLIEAKMWAGEGPEQCQRLARLWDEEAPHLIFLTRSGSAPRSAGTSAGRWRTVTWTGIADIVAAAIATCEKVDVGVQEYLRTLLVYGGNASGSDDAQLDSYLRRWAEPTAWVLSPDPTVRPVQPVQSVQLGQSSAPLNDGQWRAIEVRARAAWGAAILAAAQRWSGGPSFILEPRMSQLYIGVVVDPLVQVVLNWAHNPNGRGRGGASWPHVVIGVDPKRSGPLRQAILEGTGFVEVAFGMTNVMTTPWWLRSGPVMPDGELTDVESYADLCLARLVEVWAAVRPVIDNLARPHVRPPFPPGR
jgi:hypothetical protein